MGNEKKIGSIGKTKKMKVRDFCSFKSINNALKNSIIKFSRKRKIVNNNKVCDINYYFNCHKTIYELPKRHKEKRKTVENRLKLHNQICPFK